jgi:hypothetical protein
LRTRLAIGLSLTSLLLACGDSSPTSSAAGGDGHVVSLAIAPATVVIDVKDRQPFTVTATFDDGHEEEVTASAALTSSGAAIDLGDSVAVGTKGGDAHVTASFGGMTARADVHVGVFSPPVFFGHPNDARGSVVVAGQKGAAWFLVGEAGLPEVQPSRFDPASGAWSNEPTAPFDLVSSLRDIGGRLLIGYLDGTYEAASAAIYAPGATKLAGVHPLLSAPGKALRPWLTVSPNGQQVVALISVGDPDSYLVPGPLYAARWTAASGWSDRFKLADDTYHEAVAVADDGSFLVAYAETPAKEKNPVDVRAMFVSPSSVPSTPVTILHAAVDPWPVVATNAAGSGVVGIVGHAGGHATLFDVAGGVIASGPGFELGSTIPDDPTPTVAVLPNGDVFVAQPGTAQAGPEVLVRHPGHAPVVDFTLAKGTTVEGLIARFDGTITVLGAHGTPDTLPVDGFIQRRSPDGAWHDPRVIPVPHGDRLWFCPADWQLDGTIVVMWQPLTQGPIAASVYH